VEEDLVNMALPQEEAVASSSARESNTAEIRIERMKGKSAREGEVDVTFIGEGF
jgi:hypothetical protein